MGTTCPLLTQEDKDGVFSPSKLGVNPTTFRTTVFCINLILSYTNFKKLTRNARAIRQHWGIENSVH
ncbi:hypothetical protein ANSO36C_38570 [Nostoc cf. commune SO-36]|uniref:Transposase n=1 Tax=Nostoc cf. commune SO-36 TaxID=449208 RepID=A0ABN6Q6X1_NOSCO|nr:hypothetical protein ANSO36C_38570 [Nostoc cf. commune SO-36]